MKSIKKKKKNLASQETTIRETVNTLLCKTNGSNLGLRYDEILDLLKKDFPECKTTLKGLRWYATTFQKNNRNYVMPERPRRSHCWGKGRNPKTA